MNIDRKDAEGGLYEKFRVERTDGRSAPGEEHHGCRYFVLDLDHDPHAMPALRAYAESCAADFPALARDLRTLAVEERAWTEGEGVVRAAAGFDIRAAVRSVSHSAWLRGLGGEDVSNGKLDAVANRFMAALATREPGAPTVEVQYRKAHLEVLADRDAAHVALTAAGVPEGTLLSRIQQVLTSEEKS